MTTPPPRNAITKVAASPIAFIRPIASRNGSTSGLASGLNTAAAAPVATARASGEHRLALEPEER